MDHFQLRNGILHVEDVPLPAIAKAVGTPVYVYSRATLVRHAQVFRDGLSGLVDPHIAFAVKSRWPDMARAELNAHVEKFVALVGLSPAIDKKPSQLSGGMKQRVGIARAFSIQPKMLLLDEPFGALDALTRGTIQDELMGIVRQTQQTVFMITHDVDEAILLADRILLMSNGAETDAGYKPGGLAEVVINPLPRSRTRSQLHHLDGYYDMRNHIVDFLVTRAKAH